MKNLSVDSLTAELPLFQEDGGGASPTSTHQLKDYIVQPCGIECIKSFIEKWHYSKNTNGISSRYCFKLLNGSKTVGASIFGFLAMANQWKKYANNEDKVIELRRLCCVDDTPKNTESYFISKCLLFLKKQTEIEIVLSYADPFYGHEGTIYKASNFKFIGTSSPGKILEYQNRRYHEKSLRAKKDGVLKPFAEELNNALRLGNAKIIKTPGKNIYTYRLKKQSEAVKVPIQTEFWGTESLHHKSSNEREVI